MSKAYLPVDVNTDAWLRMEQIFDDFSSVSLLATSRLDCWRHQLPMRNGMRRRPKRPTWLSKRPAMGC